MKSTSRSGDVDQGARFRRVLSWLLAWGVGVVLPAYLFLPPRDWEEFRNVMVLVRFGAACSLLALVVCLCLRRPPPLVGSFLLGALGFGALSFLPWGMLGLHGIVWFVTYGLQGEVHFVTTAVAALPFTVVVFLLAARQLFARIASVRVAAVGLGALLPPLVGLALQRKSHELEASLLATIDIEDPEAFETALSEFGPWACYLNTYPLVTVYEDETDWFEREPTPRAERAAQAYRFATGREIEAPIWGPGSAADG